MMIHLKIGNFWIAQFRLKIVRNGVFQLFILLLRLVLGWFWALLWKKFSRFFDQFYDCRWYEASESLYSDFLSRETHTKLGSQKVTYQKVCSLFGLKSVSNLLKISLILKLGSFYIHISRNSGTISTI